MCQLEQIRDHQKRKEMMRDFDLAWHEIQSRHHRMRSEKEEFVDKCRRSEGLSIQDSLKDQMADKIVRSLAVHEEINEEQKQLALVYKEDRELEQQRLAEEKNTRKFVKEAISVSISISVVLFFYFSTENIFHSVKCERISKDKKKSWTLN